MVTHFLPLPPSLPFFQVQKSVSKELVCPERVGGNALALIWVWTLGKWGGGFSLRALTPSSPHLGGLGGVPLPPRRLLWHGLRRLPLPPSRSFICGPNAIEIEIRPVWKLLFKEVTSQCLPASAQALGVHSEEPWGSRGQSLTSLFREVSGKTKEGEEQSWIIQGLLLQGPGHFSPGGKEHQIFFPKSLALSWEPEREDGAHRL